MAQAPEIIEHEVTEDEINQAIEKASDIIDQIFEDEDSEDYDPGLVVFSLFCHATHVLHDMGWTTQDLVNEVFNHSEHHHGETLQ